MADNYLENKMEEHRRGQTRPSAKSAVRRAGVLSPGLHLTFPPMWAAIIADTAAEAQPYVSTLRNAGISVALCCRNGGKEASVLAQRLGARLYPDSSETENILADLAANGHTPAWAINLRATPCSYRSISPAETNRDIPADILARELLFMLHPEHENLLKAQNLFDIQI